MPSVLISNTISHVKPLSWCLDLVGNKYENTKLQAARFYDVFLCFNFLFMLGVVLEPDALPKRKNGLAGTKQ